MFRDVSGGTLFVQPYHELLSYSTRDLTQKDLWVVHPNSMKKPELALINISANESGRSSVKELSVTF